MNKKRKASGPHTNGLVAEVPRKLEVPPEMLPTPADIKLSPRLRKASASASAELRLTDEERELIEAYEGQIQATIAGAEGQLNIVLAPVRQKLVARLQKIEVRLRLPPGSLGKTRGYDTATGIVTAAQG